MKNKKSILLIFLFSFLGTFAQKNVSEDSKIATTCKIWGFLKYYHPTVAAGKVDWNQELVSILPKVAKTNTKIDYSLLMEQWIASLGDVLPRKQILTKDTIAYFDKNFDLSWINKNKLITNSLSNKLRFIEQNRHQGTQHYVGLLNAENVFIKNEDFSQFNWEDKNQRILALAVYWNLIEYFFPYKYIMDKKWEVTLHDFIPEILHATTDEEFYIALQKVMARTNDSHTLFVRYKKMGSYYLPVFGKIIDKKIIITKVVNSDLTQRYGVKVGDVITAINDKKVEDLIEEYRELIAASNTAGYHFKLIEPLLSGKSPQIKLDFEKENGTIAKVIDWTEYRQNRYVSTEKIKDSAKYKDKYKMLENNIGYIDMNLLKVKYVPEVLEKLRTTKAIIFDLRNYPNETYEVISNFLNDKEKEFAIYTKPVLDYPGRFKWTEGTTAGISNSNPYLGKVIVLVDEQSFSQSEWTAMCFQTAKNTTIIGSQTCGADGNIVSVDYMPAFHSSFSGIGVYYPDKRETQRIGIVPDIEVIPTIKGIQSGKDEVLERALRFIATGK